jgi:hexosaminidase
MWTEFANEENIDSRIWPRAAVVAERLWSSRNITDVEDMYLRLDSINQKLDFIGITHISGPRQILQRLAGSDSIDALSTLAEILQPNFDIRWKNKNYSSLTPLDRLIDATSPDSATARLFSKMVDKFLESPSNVVYRDTIDNQLKIWQSNHEELYRDIKQPKLLIELLPLSKMLMQIADVGLQSSAVLATGQAMKNGTWEKHQIILNEASKIIMEFVILIVPDIQKLNKAIHIVQ